MLSDDLNDIGGVLNLPDCSLVNHCVDTLSLDCKLPIEAAMAVFGVPRDFENLIKATSGLTKPLFQQSRTLQVYHTRDT